MPKKQLYVLITSTAQVSIRLMEMVGFKLDSRILFLIHHRAAIAKLCCIFVCFHNMSSFQDFLPNPPFVTMVLSSSLKPFSLITALTSLLSFRNSVSPYIYVTEQNLCICTEFICLHMTQYCLIMIHQKRISSALSCFLHTFIRNKGCSFHFRKK